MHDAMKDMQHAAAIAKYAASSGDASKLTIKSSLGQCQCRRVEFSVALKGKGKGNAQSTESGGSVIRITGLHSSCLLWKISPAFLPSLRPPMPHGDLFY
jgi:hypothetical protein